MALNALRLDYTRLHDELPERTLLSTDRALRHARRSAVNLLTQAQREDFVWGKTAELDSEALAYIARRIDQCVLDRYNDLVKAIQDSDLHLANYQELKNSRKNCGGFRLENTLLDDANFFEQMVALDHWIARDARRWHQGRRTLCFRQGDADYLPIAINSRRNVDATTMTTILGTSRGAYKAPKYSELAMDDRFENSVFIDPLDALEIVRQPYFTGATLLKSSSYKTEVIDHTRRYEITDSEHRLRTSQFACVELPGQKELKNSPTKELSSAKNLISLLKKHPEERINIQVNFEDLADEGYDDEAEVALTPRQLFEAVQEDLLNDDSTQLKEQIGKLMVTRLQPFSSPQVRQVCAEWLFEPRQ